jgi:VIT1/CCC1 family predicted Fe2+/Mn2+ transporter
MRHREWHGSGRIGWLRAAVLGANDGIVSTASLVIGVAAAGADRSAVMIAGLAGLVAGAMSMAAGEYVSVSSQADTEHSDLARERKELETDVDAEHRELAAIYIERGLEPKLAAEVSKQLMAKDALGAHARDELGISEVLLALRASRVDRGRTVARLSRTAGRCRRARRALECPERHAARHVLGRNRHGTDGRHRQRFRHCRLRRERWLLIRSTIQSGIR